MLKTREIIERLDLIDREQLSPMLKLVNIPDFYKCIAQFSGLRMNDIDDDVIFNYLHTWAKNKYRFFKLFGNKLQLDTDFDYKDENRDIKAEYRELSRRYPVYAHWLEGFNNHKSNKIDKNDLNWDTRGIMSRIFPDLYENNLEDTTITHFFKKFLNANDDLVTSIGSLYENNAIKATFTLSIDPVDIMLASDNPYGWQSCYRLELGRTDSHADGCLAAVLDTASVISYVWTSHGEFNLYDSFKFKDIRYKRMRMWLAIDDSLDTVYFAQLYPGKHNYSDEYLKEIYHIALSMIANRKNWDNVWNELDYFSVYRDFGYGYSEYDMCSTIYTNLQSNPNKEHREIAVFTVQIQSPDGDGYLPGSYNEGSDFCEDNYYDENYRYNGEGFINSNFHKAYWCEYRDDWCEYDDVSCAADCEAIGRDCYDYADAHPLCAISTQSEWEEDLVECTREGRYYPEIEEGIAYPCHGDCSGCPMWEQHHKFMGLDDNHPDCDKDAEAE